MLFDTALKCIVFEFCAVTRGFAWISETRLINEVTAILLCFITIRTNWWYMKQQRETLLFVSSISWSLKNWIIISLDCLSNFWQVTSVSYHPKDNCMLTSSVDGTVLVWKTWCDRWWKRKKVDFICADPAGCHGFFTQSRAHLLCTDKQYTKFRHKTSSDYNLTFVSFTEFVSCCKTWNKVFAVFIESVSCGIECGTRVCVTLSTLALYSLARRECGRFLFYFIFIFMILGFEFWNQGQAYE